MTGPMTDSASSFSSELERGERFEFGENWQRFLKVIDEARIGEAERALAEMLAPAGVAGLSFLDVGSGSGLSSLVAARLDARRIHSFDHDPASVACTQQVKRRYGPPDANWTVETGSALDAGYLRSLGRFDVVYSWGVLHHTGDMWTALAIAAGAVADDGRLFIAIYNDQGGRSHLWRAVKRTYNRLPAALQTPYAIAVMAPREVSTAIKLLLRGRPMTFVRSWTTHRRRGMSRWHDLRDWVGGYPFEVASPEAVLDAVRPLGFELERMTTCRGGIGCNQYVFSRRAC